MLQEFADLNDDKTRHFAALAVSSGLISSSSMIDLIRLFCNTYPDKNTRSLNAFSSFLIARRTLTPWQAEKLHDGRSKGFFLDQFILLSHVRVDETRSVFLALDTTTQRKVLLGILPPTKEAVRDGRVMYDVIGPFD